MAIEINGSPHANAAATGAVAGNGSPPARNEPAPVKPETERTGARDTVSLTDTAQQLRSLEHNLAQQPVVDTQRVESIKQAIENGTYEVNPERIAGKMMEMEHALSGLGLH